MALAVRTLDNFIGGSWVASTGDSGANGQDPSFSPNVVAVGGTSLYLAQTAAPKRAYETVWNDNGTQDLYEQLIGLHCKGCP